MANTTTRRPVFFSCCGRRTQLAHSATCPVVVAAALAEVEAELAAAVDEIEADDVVAAAGHCDAACAAAEAADLVVLAPVFAAWEAATDALDLVEPAEFAREPVAHALAVVRELRSLLAWFPLARAASRWPAARRGHGVRSYTRSPSSLRESPAQCAQKVSGSQPPSIIS